MSDNRQTLVINLVAGPCSGKSTIAAELFARLKKMGIHCELVPEYIKDRIYEENNTIITNQIALFGMEVYGLDNKLGKVDIIVHDGSLLNNIVYDNSGDELFHKFIMHQYNKYNNLDFFIKRGNIEFEDYGRIHNYDQSLELDDKIKYIYFMAGARYTEVESRDAVDKIIPIILKEINLKEKDNLN